MQSDSGVTARDRRPIEHDERCRALTVSAPDAIVTIDERSLILSVNRATQRIFGWSPDELIGQPLSVLMPVSYPSRHDAGMAD